MPDLRLICSMLPALLAPTARKRLLLHPVQPPRGCGCLDSNDWKDGIKQGYANLREVLECVISYYGHDMVRESWIAGCPVPKGISEIDVMGCTQLPSKVFKPCGIAE